MCSAPAGNEKQSQSHSRPLKSGSRGKSLNGIRLTLVQGFLEEEQKPLNRMDEEVKVRASVELQTSPKDTCITLATTHTHACTHTHSVCSQESECQKNKDCCLGFTFYRLSALLHTMWECGMQAMVFLHFWKPELSCSKRCGRLSSHCLAPGQLYPK